QTVRLREIKPRVPRRLNEYELVEPIGRGGMGLVYRARHMLLQRTVAIKVLPHLALADESAVRRMRRESAAAGRVQHPNIVYATDAGECDGVHFLVMEFVHGIDLSKLVAVASPLPVADACEIVRQAALGLAHIAECGLVHRDLKPSNIMLASDGRVKILDLGLALLREGQIGDSESPTQSGYLLGTADYVAPEQLLDSHDADVRSDLYSLGCSLFKLLSGQAPFGGVDHGSVAKKLSAHQHVAPPAIGELRPDAPPEVAAVLGRLLAKRPDDRFQTPTELVEALTPLAHGADLPALCMRALERAELDGLPLPQRSRTPRPAEASTETRGATPTPHPATRMAARPGWIWPVSIAIGALALAIGLWAVVPGPKTSPTQVPTTLNILMPKESGRLFGRYDLASAPREYIWPGYIKSPFPAQYDSGTGRLSVLSDNFQLIQIGHYDGRPATFSLDIEQRPWHGDAGLFFNLHLKNPGKGPEVAAFNPIYFSYYPGAKTEHMQVFMTNAWIGLSPRGFRHDFQCGDSIDFPTDRLRLSVTIDQGGVREITVNGKPAPALTEEPSRSRYASRDMRGVWGIYSFHANKMLSPTWFSNVEVTPGENSEHGDDQHQFP
ncbi:MAG: protein kinase, partial [Planctomycetaceae bacterium]|nr:protein kinase [Planctomycetaceae bacterium]